MATVETARSVEAAADVLRPEITLASAVRWVRRRLMPVRRALLAVVTLWPDLFTVTHGWARCASRWRRRPPYWRCGPTPPRTWRRCRRRSDSAPAPPGETRRRPRSHTGWGQTAPVLCGEDPARRIAATRRADATTRSRDARRHHRLVSLRADRRSAASAGRRSLAPRALREKAEREYDIPGTTRRRVAAETLRDWLYAYRRGGFDGLKPRPRADQGHARALPQDRRRSALRAQRGAPRLTAWRC